MGYRGGRQMGLMMNVPTKDYIVETIKEEILSGQIKPGTELAQPLFTGKEKQSRLSAFCSIPGIAFCVYGRLYDLAAFAAFGQ